MHMLKQTEPVDVGPGNVIGELIDTDINPIDALKTIHRQIEKMREWNCESLSDSIDKANDSLQGIQLTAEVLESQLQAVIANPLFAAASDMLEACSAVVDRWESGDLAQACRMCAAAIAKAKHEHIPKSACTRA